jgi:hypothetical protein
MTSPWEHPPLHANCIPCLTAENTKLQREVERLTRERDWWREEVRSWHHSEVCGTICYCSSMMSDADDRAALAQRGEGT